MTIDIPPPALYKDDTDDHNVVPNLPLFDVLGKFDGKTVIEGRVERRLYKIKKLPKYLILHYKRFTKNEFFKEKNPTIINFPLNNLDFSPCNIFNNFLIIFRLFRK